MAVSGGLADREFGSWMKKLNKNEKFITPKAIISVCSGGGIDKISQRLTSSIERFVDEGPEVNKIFQLYLMSIVQHGDALLMKI